MAHKTRDPALFSLLVFLGTNYAVGYGIGHLLTGSAMVSIALALVMPCLTLFGMALLDRRRALPEMFDEL